MWPWKRTETRADNYTEAILQQLLASAEGGPAQNATAAIEVCSGLWARGFASAVVRPETASTQALTPAVLAYIGRQLHTCGQAVLEIVVEDGDLELRPAASWDVTGGVNPASWEWTLTLAGPSETVTSRMPPSHVLNLTYSIDPSQPWVGVGPLGHARTSLDLLNRLETRLAEEMGQAVGSTLAVPDVTTSGKLQTDLRAPKGELVLVQGMQSGWDDPAKRPTQGGHTDWLPRRLGANPPDALRALRLDVSTVVLAASGVPVTLLGGSDTLAREAWRQMARGTLASIGRIIAPALADGLDAPGLEFDWEELGGSDLQGRAKSFQALVSGGMSVADAVALSGLVTHDD